MTPTACFSGQRESKHLSHSQTDTINRQQTRLNIKVQENIVSNVLEGSIAKDFSVQLEPVQILSDRNKV